MSSTRSRFTRLLLATAALSLSACVKNAPQYLPLVVEDAAEQRKPLVVELYAEWCKPCQYFEKDVLPDPRVQEALRDVIFVRYDVDRPTGQDAQARCRTNAVPALVGIDHEGKIRLLLKGAPDADKFLAFLQQAKQVLGTPTAAAAK